MKKTLTALLFSAIACATPNVRTHYEITRPDLIGHVIELEREGGFKNFGVRSRYNARIKDDDKEYDVVGYGTKYFIELQRAKKRGEQVMVECADTLDPCQALAINRIERPLDEQYQERK